jgi:hypothetical protein
MREFHEEPEKCEITLFITSSMDAKINIIYAKIIPKCSIQENVVCIIKL